MSESVFRLFFSAVGLVDDGRARRTHHLDGEPTQQEAKRIEGDADVSFRLAGEWVPPWEVDDSGSSAPVRT
ncbi:hypothetical protein WB401_28875 [Streptomyces brasiliscabiei]|uniref:Uncharacterized protein n=1 Tax=Streptomyces brasiliscabiei TaxID=2736302 RepID=A0ABU8GLB6_9ACTN